MTSPPAARGNPVFDRLLDEAEPELLAGEHQQDGPPVDGGRWPVSVVAVPDGGTRTLLAEVMTDAVAYAGPDHFETGRASHFTVRALEPHRQAAAPDDAVARDWVAALEAVGRSSAPVTLRLTGVTLSAGGVLVQAEPADGGAWELMRHLRAALGPLAWFEDQWGARDIWYASVLHFAAPITDPAGLVAWARAHRASLTHDVTVDSLDLVRFRYAETGGRHMAMERWHTTPLGASSQVT